MGGRRSFVNPWFLDHDLSPAEEQFTPPPFDFYNYELEIKDPPFASATWDAFPNPSLLTIPEANAAANMEFFIADYFGIDRSPATWPEPNALKPLLEKVMDAGPSVALA